MHQVGFSGCLQRGHVSPHHVGAAHGVGFWGWGLGGTVEKLDPNIIDI